MADTPFVDGEISVTIKHGGRHEDPWLVVRGTPQRVKAQLIEFFDLDEKGTGEYDSKSPSDVLYEAVKQADAEYAATKQLGGRVVRKSSAAKAEPKQEDSPPWSEERAEEKANPILAQIEQINTVDDLKLLWAENQAAFKEGAVMDAWKARGKELKEKENS